MHLPQITDFTLTQSSVEPFVEVSINNYLSNSQIVQPLSDLMVEIITFQLRERALFTDVEITAYSLN